MTNPLTVRKTLTVHDLEDLALVLPPSHRPHRVAVERALHSADVNWTLAIEAEGWPLMLHFVTLGVGLAVVNGCVRTPTGLTSRPISGMPLIPYYAAYLPGRDQDPRVADLLAAISSRFT